MYIRADGDAKTELNQLETADVPENHKHNILRSNVPTFPALNPKP